jgi:hypothetical protein
MTDLRQKFFLHIKLARGGFLYGYEIIDRTGKVVGTKSVRQEKAGDKIVTTLKLGDAEFANVEELDLAYRKQLEAERRDQEWEAHAPC